jgi:DNA-binding response OmpR family regulator
LAKAVSGLGEGTVAERRDQSLSSTARVLVTSDNQDDAAQVADLLKSEFGHVSESTDPETEVEDFEAFEPHVLVLAFETIEKAQSYALRLYRISRKVSAHAHRTVVLCNKDQVRTAFGLCKNGSFDDYVLYWPHAQDGLRLTMTVLSALRQMSATVVRGPSHIDLVSHVRQVSAIQSVIDEQLKAAEQLSHAASGSLIQGEGTIRAGIDELYELLAGPDAIGIVDVKDRPALDRVFEALKSDPVSRAFKSTASAVEPAASKLASILRDKLAPHMRALASLGEKVSKTRPVVMLVDDDDVMQLLVAGALDRTPYELVSAQDATVAVSLLRRKPSDLILMDVNLPDFSGITLTQRLKLVPDFAGIPVVMLTSEGRRETIEDSLKAGAADFIVKPFTKEALIKKLDRFLLASGHGPSAG